MVDSNIICILTFIHCPLNNHRYDDAGLLTESLRRRPYQVLLLDEFEKGHPDVWVSVVRLFVFLAYP